MTDFSSTGLSRRGVLAAFAATMVTAAPTFSNAAGFLRGAGDIRRLRMVLGYQLLQVTDKPQRPGVNGLAQR